MTYQQKAKKKLGNRADSISFLKDEIRFTELFLFFGINAQMLLFKK